MFQLYWKRGKEVKGVIRMGYIPPVRDDQSLQYVNRQEKASSSIKTLTAAERAEFFSAMEKNRQERLNYLFMTPKVKQKSKEETEFEKEFTGRGEHFDTSV